MRTKKIEKYEPFGNVLAEWTAIIFATEYGYTDILTEIMLSQAHLTQKSASKKFYDAT